MMPTPAPDPTEATTAVVPDSAGVVPDSVAHNSTAVVPDSIGPVTQVRVPFHARSNRILIKTDASEKVIGRIVIPDTAADKDGRDWSGLTVRTATVISMGPGLRVAYSKWKGYRDENDVPRWPMPAVRPGSHILYRAWAGHDVVIEDENYQIISGNLVDAEILSDGRLELCEDRLLVRRRRPLEQTRGGIWIPEISQKSSLEGEVVQAGYGKIITNGTITPMDAQLGDHVTWKPMKGVDVTRYVPHLRHVHDGTCALDRSGCPSNEIVLLFETDLIGVIEGEHFEPVVSMTREK